MKFLPNLFHQNVGFRAQAHDSFITLTAFIIIYATQRL